MAFHIKNGVLQTPYKLMYVGNALQRHGKNPTSIEVLSPLFVALGFKVITTSHQRFPLVRLMDMIITFFRHYRSSRVVVIDVYSTWNFYYALVISQLCRIFTVPYILKLEGGALPKRLQRSPFWCRQLFSPAFVLVAPSSYLAQIFQARYATSVQIIPNTLAVDNYPFKVRLPQSRSISLLWVRSFHPLYDPLFAVAIAHALQAYFDRVHLCMVGPDYQDMQSRCVALAKNCGVSLECTGALSKSEWIRLSSDYSLFLNTSTQDNCPLTLIEAMALGLPVVSRAVGGIPHLIEHNVNGIVMDRQATADDYARTIYTLFQSPADYQRLCVVARERVLAFDWDTVQKSWLDVLSKL